MKSPDLNYLSRGMQQLSQGSLQSRPNIPPTPAGHQCVKSTAIASKLALGVSMGFIPPANVQLGKAQGPMWGGRRPEANQHSGKFSGKLPKAHPVHPVLGLTNIAESAQPHLRTSQSTSLGTSQGSLHEIEAGVVILPG